MDVKFGHLFWRENLPVLKLHMEKFESKLDILNTRKNPIMGEMRDLHISVSLADDLVVFYSSLNLYWPEFGAHHRPPFLTHWRSRYSSFLSFFLIPTCFLPNHG